MKTIGSASSFKQINRVGLLTTHSGLSDDLSLFLDRHLFPEAGLLAIGHFDLLVTSHLLFVFFSYFQLLKNNLWLTVHQ